MNKLIGNIRKEIKNQNLVDIIIRITNIKKNIKYKKVIKKLTEVDTILNPEGFLKNIDEFRNDIEQGEIRPHFLGCENAAYGYFYALQEYAGFKCKNFGINMEHGVDFSEPDMDPLVLDENMAFFFQEKYKEKKIHDAKKEGLAFNIGPYIHYAKSYYDDNTLKKIKDKWGKTVLIYISHSTHESKIERKYDTYYRYYEKYKDQYDTIAYCVYWRDLNKELYDKISEFPKAIIVSAGFIYDKNFVSKTKSLIILSDLVVTDEIGTSVGYALYLGKKIDYIATQDVRINNLIGKALDKDLENKTKIGDAITKNKCDELDNLYDQFWSPGKVRSCEDIKLILEGLDEIRKKSRFNKNNYDNTILEMIGEWNLEINDKRKSQLFLEALGRNVK